MPYETLLLSKNNQVATVTLNRPHRLNALNNVLIREIKEVMQELADDDAIKSILLTGSGRGFCAGADILGSGLDKTLEKRAQQGQRTRKGMQLYFNPIIQIMRNMEKPIIGAINGVAAGYGMSLALACDVVFAAESASFVQVFVPQLGIVPDGGATWFLPHLIGKAKAMGMILTGKKVKAKEAEAWGMIWQCLPDDQFLEIANNFAHHLANGPTLGIASAKLALNQADNNSLDEQLLLELHLQQMCIATEDFVEGTQAFAEKRQPKFEGK